MNDIHAYFKEQVRQMADANGWNLSYFNVENQVFGFKHGIRKHHIDIRMKSMKAVRCINQRGQISIAITEKLDLFKINQIFIDPETRAVKWNCPDVKK